MILRNIIKVLSLRYDNINTERKWDANGTQMGRALRQKILIFRPFFNHKGTQMGRKWDAIDIEKENKYEQTA